MRSFTAELADFYGQEMGNIVGDVLDGLEREPYPDQVALAVSWFRANQDSLKGMPEGGQRDLVRRLVS
ncbi:MAG TPA: hypothetical protein VMU33_18380 [Burkholderiaceae bacterium]|nr:hypothetical protein [Burkholderiaceae bacterium]